MRGLSDMAEAQKAHRAATPASAQPRPSWLELLLVGEFIFAPLVRGALWLFMHLLLAIKIAFVTIFLS